MSWHHVKGTVIGEGILDSQIRVKRTLLVETENGQRVVIAPKGKVLNKLSTGDVIAFDTQRGKDERLSWYLGRLKRNCKSLTILGYE